jgi:hypothetical protein
LADTLSDGTSQVSITQIERSDVKVRRAIDPRPSLIAWVRIRVGEVPTINIPVRSISGVIKIL